MLGYDYVVSEGNIFGAILACSLFRASIGCGRYNTTGAISTCSLSRANLSEIIVIFLLQISFLSSILQLHFFLSNYPCIDSNAKSILTILLKSKEDTIIKQSQLLLSSNLYAEAERRLSELKYFEGKLQRDLQKAPPGNIRIARSKNNIQFYLRDNPLDKCGKYIPKTENGKISTYLQKRYNERALTLIQREINSLELFLQNSDIHFSRYISVFNSNPFDESIKIPSYIRDLYSSLPSEVKSHICPLDISDDDFASQWLSQPFISKEFDVSNNRTIYTTDRDEIVRSKSELNIANALCKHNIPYRYECQLILRNGISIFPDFTILDVQRRMVRFWEHRGMMDDRGYANHSVLRLKDYNSDNIFLGDQLIITEETSSHPLGTREIEDVIKHYFLE